MCLSSTDVVVRQVVEREISMDGTAGELLPHVDPVRDMGGYPGNSVSTDTETARDSHDSASSTLLPWL